MKVTVWRAPRDKRGPTVVSSLLTDVVTAREKGTQLIDRNCSSRIIEQCQGPKREVFQDGLLAQVTEAEQIWRGMVTYWSRILTLDSDNNRFTADMNVYIERVRDDG